MIKEGRREKGEDGEEDNTLFTRSHILIYAARRRGERGDRCVWHEGNEEVLECC